MPRKATGAGSLRLAVDPDRPLAALGRVVDALDEVPGDARGRRLRADPGRPAPARVALVVAGRLVVDAAAATSQRRPAPRPFPRSASPPACGSSPSRRRWGRSLRSAAPRRGAGWRAGPASRSRAAARPSSPRGCRGAAWCGRRVGAPRGPDHPERLAERADLGPRRAEHQLLGEDADVAPALAQLPVAPQRHRPGGSGRSGRSVPGPRQGSGRRHRSTVVARLGCAGGPGDPDRRRPADPRRFRGGPVRPHAPDSRLYLALNLVGSAILAVLAVDRRAVGLPPARGRLGDRLRLGPGRRRFEPPGDRPLCPRRSSLRAARRAVSSRARGRPRRRPPSRSAVGGPLDAGVAQGRDVLEDEEVLAGLDQGAAQFRGRRSRIALSRIASREPCSRSSSAAVFGPTPLAPGSPSEGSPRRAMKSGTSSGPMP